MKIMRMQNAMRLELLDEWLLPDEGDPDHSILKNQLRTHLEAGSPFLLVLLVVGEQNTEGLLIAQAPENWNHVFIAQMHVSQKASANGMSDQMFLRLIQWAQSLGRDEVLMETKRDPDAITRRWKFIPVSTTMSFSIAREFQAFLVSKRNGDQDGTIRQPVREQQAEDNVNVDARPAGRVGPPERVPAEADGDRSPGIRGSIVPDSDTLQSLSWQQDGGEANLSDLAGVSWNNESPGGVQPESVPAATDERADDGAVGESELQSRSTGDGPVLHEHSGKAAAS